MSYLKRLAKLEEAFKNAKAPERAKGLPPGDHTCKLTSAVLREGKSEKTKGNLFVDFKFTVLTGEAKGEKGTKSINLDYEDDKNGRIGLGLLKGDLQTLGIKLTKISMLEKALEKAKGLIVKVRSVEKGGYFNLYLNELVDAPDEDDDLTGEDESEETTLDDDTEHEDAEESEEETEEESEDESEDAEEAEEAEEEKPAPKVGKKKTSKKKPGKKPAAKKPAKEEKESDDDEDDEDFDSFMEGDDDSEDEE